MRPQLGRLVVLPFATIGVIAAVLVWEVEHVGSVLLSLAIVAGGLAIGVVVARRLRDDMERVADHYEALLEAADDASRRAEAASRLKDEFLATLSHELRTPLNSILGWARLLSSGKLDAPQQQRAINAIERAGWSQSRLIEDLLDISRMVAGRFKVALEPTDLPQVVKAAIESLRPALQARRLDIGTAIDAHAPTIAADPVRLQQVVWHLLSNAIKFTPPGGRIDVSLVSSGDEIRLSVRDTGIGFRPEVAAHLFERFRQGDSSTTREYGGLGLGLGIVRHVVELHGGTVSASSGGEHEGSVFEVRLPIRPLELPAARPTPVEGRARSLQGVLVLVVDDDPQALDFARTVLEQSGAVVVTASSARDARVQFQKQRPDVIVSDLVMPDVDGLELIRGIRALERPGGRPTPAAALTALARTDDRRRALTAGFQMHLSKPIDPTELVITVERLARPGSSSAAVH